ncbi:MAG: hypothetical protein JWO33_396 [Caulobacteraceae bacterium]|nr:hypothetical protein [Caulobacteraceae bacterium]
MIQVAFAGHNRPHDLGRHGPVIAGLDAAFAMLQEAGVGQARLLTGLATGADELAAAAWRRTGLGPVHAVFPFVEEPHQPPIGPAGLADSATWLDGAASEADGRNPHLKQTRLIVETADLVVVVWNGEPARGAGGTADAVLSALELGLPVLWVKPSDHQRLRMIRPELLPSDFHFPEFREALEKENLRHLEIATPLNLRQVLGLDAPSPENAEANPKRSGWHDWLDEWLHRWLWKTHRNFRVLVGGKVEGVEPGPETPPDLAGQPGFKFLTAAYAEADLRANRLSAVHRSEQLLLILAMIAAAIIGSIPDLVHGFKLPAVVIELTLGVAALMVWATASDSRQHEQWGLQRYLAEQLRLERAGWTLGVSLASVGVASRAPNQLDVARDARRAAGLPHGRYLPERVHAWGAWAMSELVQGQSGYHRAIGVRDGRIAHRIHFAEDMSFLALFVLFCAYLALHFAMPHDAHMPEWVGGVVSMGGVVVPAMAAATMALEAKLEFGEQSERSKRIAAALETLARRLGPSPSFDELQHVARAAMRLHIAESSHWREGVSRRRLFRP